MTAPEMLRLSLRECRLILERLVQAAGVPAGLLLSVRDCALYSALLPGPGLVGIAEQLARLRAPPAAPCRIVVEAPRLVIDCGGRHAWLVAETLLDLAIDRLRRGEEAELHAVGIGEAGELRVVTGLAEPHGLEAAAIDANGEMTLRLRPRAANAPSLLDHLRHEGLAASPDIWWPPYHASHAALAPDTLESRRHSGTIRVEADGRIVGRNDEDETDLSMLAPGRPHSEIVPSAS